MKSETHCLFACFFTWNTVNGILYIHLSCLLSFALMVNSSISFSSNPKHVSFQSLLASSFFICKVVRLPYLQHYHRYRALKIQSIDRWKLECARSYWKLVNAQTLDMNINNVDFLSFGKRPRKLNDSNSIQLTTMKAEELIVRYSKRFIYDHIGVIFYL